MPIASRNSSAIILFLTCATSAFIAPAVAQQFDPHWETGRQIERQWQEYDAMQRQYEAEQYAAPVPIQPNLRVEKAFQLGFDCLFKSKNCEKLSDPLDE